MAIVSANTNISGASAAASAATFQTLLRDALVAHPSGAWTLEEEFDSSSGNIHWVVIKNTATVSGELLDFYLVIGRFVSTGQMIFFVCETYTTGTHVCGKYPPGWGTGQVVAADGSYAGTFTLATAFPSGASQPDASVIFTCLAAFKYIYAIDSSYFILSTNIFSGPYYFGYGTSFTSIPDPGFIITGAIGIWQSLSGNGGVRFTRHLVPSSQIVHQAWSSNPPGFLTLENPRWALSPYSIPDRLQNSVAVASRIWVVMFSSFYTVGFQTPDISGALRGVLRNVRYALVPTSAAYGDTVVVDGRKFVINTLSSASASYYAISNSSNNSKTGTLIDTGAA